MEIYYPDLPDTNYILNPPKTIFDPPIAEVPYLDPLLLPSLEQVQGGLQDQGSLSSEDDKEKSTEEVSPITPPPTLNNLPPLTRRHQSPTTTTTGGGFPSEAKVRPLGSESPIDPEVWSFQQEKLDEAQRALHTSRDALLRETQRSGEMQRALELALEAADVERRSSQGAAARRYAEGIDFALSVERSAEGEW